jgi:WD40 repeat protein
LGTRWSVLVTGDDRGAVRVWEAATGAERFSAPAVDGPVCLAAWSADGALLATAGENSATVRLVDGSTGEARVVLSGGRRCQVAGGAWSPTSRNVLAVQGNRRVRIWDTTNVNVQSELLPAGGYGLAWSPDGQRLATLLDETIGIWDVAENVERRVIIDRGNWQRCLAWSPDGRRLAVGGTDSRVRIWDPDLPHPLAVLEGHPGAVFTVSWSPDGLYLVSAGVGRIPLLWEVPVMSLS